MGRLDFYCIAFTLQTFLSLIRQRHIKLPANTHPPARASSGRPGRPESQPTRAGFAADRRLPAA